MLKVATTGDRHIFPYNRYSIFLAFLPYLLVLLLTIIGVAYTSVNKTPLVIYWEFLAVITGAVCILSGWPHAPNRDDRVRLVWTQVLHWAAFLAAIESRARLGRAENAEC